VYGSFLPLESFLYLSLTVACFFVLLCPFLLVLGRRRRVAVGAVGDGETGSVSLYNVDNLKKLDVLIA
jgi:hypothetical protein